MKVKIRPHVHAGLLVLGGIFTAANGGAAGAEGAERIVSLNLCADQYLITLADKSQVVALSPLAREKTLSFHAEAAEDYPVVQSRAAAVMAKEPDLVITGAFTGGPTVAMLKRHNFPVLELPNAQTIPEITAQIRTMASAVGRPERGEAMIAALESALPETTEAANPEAPTAIFYQRRGFATGTDSLIDSVMAAAGLKNLLGELDIAGTRHIPLEMVIAHEPDFLIVDSPADAPDLGSDLPHHPALARLIPAHRRLFLSPRLMFCAGPMVAEAIKSLRRQAETARSKTD